MRHGNKSSLYYSGCIKVLRPRINASKILISKPWQKARCGRAAQK